MILEMSKKDTATPATSTQKTAVAPTPAPVSAAVTQQGQTAQPPKNNDMNNSNIATQRVVAAPQKPPTEAKAKATTAPAPRPAFNLYDYAPRRSRRASGKDSGLIWSKTLVTGKGDMLLTPTAPDVDGVADVETVALVTKPIRTAARLTSPPGQKKKPAVRKTPAPKKKRKKPTSKASGEAGGGSTTKKKVPAIPAAQRVMKNIACVLGNFWNVEEHTPRARKRRNFLTPGVDDSNRKARSSKTADADASNTDSSDEASSGNNVQTPAAPSRKRTASAISKDSKQPAAVKRKRSAKKMRTSNAEAVARLNKSLGHIESPTATAKSQVQQLEARAAAAEEAPVTKKVVIAAPPTKQTIFQAKWGSSSSQNQTQTKKPTKNLFAPVASRLSKVDVLSENVQLENYQQATRRAWSRQFAPATTATEKRLPAVVPTMDQERTRVARAYANENHRQLHVDRKISAVKTSGCSFNIMDACRTMLSMRSPVEKEPTTFTTLTSSGSQSRRVEIEAHRRHQLDTFKQMEQLPYFQPDQPKDLTAEFSD